ncbi:DUF6907 domain-containing protein [Streptomyces sp. NPDC058368]|uniref:DUF6907 domain-containing protein n=1 Tax=Streptomyces sp. NPDC058368 TaxID=3346461 RepID=UPI00364A0880
MSISDVADNAQPMPSQAVPATTRKTVTFTHRDTGQPMTFACMPGCIFDHCYDASTPTHPSDIWCQTERTDVTLPINENGTPEEFRVLGITLNVRPWDAKVSQRLPHASIEVIDDCWIEDLDPDALAHVIATLASRLDVLKDAHAQLIELRTGYEVQS